MKLVTKISKLNKNCFGIEVVTETEPAMRKTNNPFVGRVKKVTTYSNAVLGVSYQNTINNRLKRNGYESNYVSEAPKGKKHYNAFFYVSLDEQTYYLKIGMYKTTIVKSTYFIDGNEATKNQIEQLKPFLQSKSHTVLKQAEAGLNEEEQYLIVAPKVDNIVSVKLGNRTIYQRF